MELQRTTSDNEDFRALVKQLDVYLARMDGDDHAFYAQYNTLDTIKHVVLAYIEGEPVGCGAIKHWTDEAMEVKRMYTSEAHRGKGIAHTILIELEGWASELGYKRCVLETGRGQVEAVRLYERNGYTVIPNYGQYAGVDYSICFAKTI